MRWEPGKIVYCQGRYRCRVVSDDGDTIAYIPLEGYAPGEKGKTFHAWKGLFEEQESKKERCTCGNPLQESYPHPCAIHSGRQND